MAGEFEGAVGAPSRPKATRFYDHFIQDKPNVIVRRMSNIDFDIWVDVRELKGKYFAKYVF